MVSSRTLLVEVKVFKVFGEIFEGRMEYQGVRFGIEMEKDEGGCGRDMRIWTRAWVRSRVSVVTWWQIGQSLSYCIDGGIKKYGR